MRVLRTSLAARASQEAKRVSEQEREDEGDHDEPSRNVADQGLKGEKEEGEEEREHRDEGESEDEKRFVEPSVKPGMRMGERSGIYRHEPASRCRWDECDGGQASRINRGTRPSRFLFRVISNGCFMSV